MSSTNRSLKRDYHKKDYYVTPVQDIFHFLNEFTKVEPGVLEGEILDPCAGGDNSRPMSYPVAIKRKVKNTDITTVDIRHDSRAEIKQDYLETKFEDEFDLIITNPPFRNARDIIEKAFEDVKEGGFIVMLLRLNYFGSKKRKPFWDKQLPKYAFVHHQRMSFTEDGKTDSIEYMHCCWQKGYNPESVKLKII